MNEGERKWLWENQRRLERESHLTIGIHGENPDGINTLISLLYPLPICKHTEWCWCYSKFWENLRCSTSPVPLSAQLTPLCLRGKKKKNGHGKMDLPTGWILSTNLFYWFLLWLVRVKHWRIIVYFSQFKNIDCLHGSDVWKLQFVFLLIII